MRRIGAALVAAAAVLAFIRHPAGPAAALALAVAGAWLADRPALRVALRAGVILVAVFSAAITAALVMWSSGLDRGLSVGGSLLLRLMVLLLVVSMLARSVDADLLIRGAERLGLRRLGLTFGLALNVLAHLGEAVRETWAALAARSGRTRPRLRQLPILGEVLLAHTARIADEAAAAAALRGHAALTLRLGALVASTPVVVVSGGPGSGKTAAMQQVVSELQRRGVPVAGFLQPGVWQEGRKVGFRVLDVVTGDEAALADQAGDGEGERGTRFRFHSAGFELARRSLEQAGPGTVLVVDELGPVELRGEGHMPAVRAALLRSDLLAAVVVVRSNLVPALLTSLEATRATVVDVGRGPEPASAVIRGLPCGP